MIAEEEEGVFLIEISYTLSCNSRSLSISMGFAEQNIYLLTQGKNRREMIDSLSDMIN